MRTSIYMLLMVLLASSCLTQKAYLKKFPPVIKHDTVFTPGEILFEGITVEVEIPGDTDLVATPWLDESRWTDDFSSVALESIIVNKIIEPIRAEAPFAYSKAWVENNTLKMLLIQKDSILEIHIDSAKQSTRDTIRIDVLETVEVPVTPKSFSFFKSGFWILLGLILLIVIIAFVFIKRK